MLVFDIESACVELSVVETVMRLIDCVEPSTRKSIILSLDLGLTFQFQNLYNASPINLLYSYNQMKHFTISSDKLLMESEEHRKDGIEKD